MEDVLEEISDHDPDQRVRYAAEKLLHERRKALGGYVPQRITTVPKLKTPDRELFDEFQSQTLPATSTDNNRTKYAGVWFVNASARTMPTRCTIVGRSLPGSERPAPGERALLGRVARAQAIHGLPRPVSPFYE